MFTKGILLFVLVAISLLLLVVSIIISIVKRKDKNKRNTWIGIAILFFVIALGTTIYTSLKVFEVTKNKGIDVVQDFAVALGEHLSRRYGDTAFLDSIQKMQPSDISIPNPYYYCAGFSDYYRMPLIYPYSMVSIDNLLIAEIKDESNIENIFEEANTSKQVIAKVSRFYFTKDILVTELVGDTINRDTLFSVLNFHNKEIQNFHNKVDLKDFLKKQNLPDSLEMMTVKEYYYKF